jgi:FAD/FMN-containing dehydrogenase/Fe-S oxidoreductase
MSFDPQQLTRDLRGSFRGRLALDDLTRGLYSTDASPFQIQPLGVAVPADAADLAVLVKYCFDHNIPMIPRGAGTGLAGESLGPALVIDLSTNFRRVLDISADTVTVEPGVVLAELNAELARRGRRFAPDPASAASCTVGGMVATNASGGNAFRFGYTRDHVVSLDFIHDDGTTGGDRGAADLIRANLDLIEKYEPRTPFNRCGYLLHDVLTDGGLDLAKLLVGSEGTLAFVTAATLRTLPLAGGTCVALLGFPTFDRAIRAGLELRDLEATGCDLLDRRLLSLTRAEPHGVPASVGAALFITVEDDSERLALARTPWVEKQYGELMPVFREVKRIFDPKGLLNPGKIIGPDPSRPAWPLRPVGDTETRRHGDTETEIPSRVAATRSGALPLLVWSNTTPDAEAARCNGCGDCRPRGTATRMCPVFRADGSEAATPRAKANLFRLLTDPASEEAKAVADLCVNCKMCRDECPARVNVPKLALEAKAAHHAEHGLTRADWMLARTESFASLGSNFAPIVNGLMGRLSVRWFLEKVFGLSRRRRLQAFALRNFIRRARGMGLCKKRGMRNAECGIPNVPEVSSIRNPQSAIRNIRVAYFVDIFANYNDPSIGDATVAVLRHNGVAVYVPPRQVGCGMAPLSVGDVETAREMAVRNLRVFADLVRDGYTVVCSEPTAALMLSQDYLDLLDNPTGLADDDAQLVAENTVELTTFLWDLHRAGALKTDFARLDVALGHHVPCHLKALRGPAAGPGLLSLIPGVRAHTIDVSCSGMAGTWGLKAANHAASLAAGKPMLDALDRPGILFGSTECSACRMQMQEGTGKRTLHPVQYLAHAYGLLPEIGARLRRPLTPLVSD